MFMGVRKLEGVSRDLTPLAEQGAAAGFFSNVQNADELSRLVEDIRDAIMDYQVRPILGISTPIAPNLRIRRPYNKGSTIRAANSS